MTTSEIISANECCLQSFPLTNDPKGNGNQTDEEYFRLLKNILKYGRCKKNRTGVDTISLFGEMAKFEVRMDAFPILTTKKVHFKSVVHELLWFIKGDTNIKYLVDNGVSIWNEWAYKRYNDACGTKDCPNMDAFIRRLKDLPADDRWVRTWGNLGEGTYGSMWRAFPFWCPDDKFFQDNPEAATLSYDGKIPNIDYYYKEEEVFGVVDQLHKVVDTLKTNPDDRRIIVSAWHPYWVDHCVLPPCHCLFHFNTEELTDLERCNIAESRGHNVGWTSVHELNKKQYDALNIPTRRLNLLMYIRSNDFFLGMPFNITSYSLLLAMTAQVVNMHPGILTYVAGDLHIYENHMEQVKEQLSRTPKSLPRLWLNTQINDLFKFQFEDIKLEGYDPHPTIKAPIAV